MPSFSPFSLVPPDDPVLRTVARAVFEWEIPALGDPKFLYWLGKFLKQCDGQAIAAPQFGDSRAYFLWDDGLVINPRITFRGGMTEERTETCLSFPGREALVERPIEIAVEYTDENRALRSRHLHYHRARVFLHEYDHLIGKCIV